MNYLIVTLSPMSTNSTINVIKNGSLPFSLTTADLTPNSCIAYARSQEVDNIILIGSIPYTQKFKEHIEEQNTTLNIQCYTTLRKAKLCLNI